MKISSRKTLLLLPMLAVSLVGTANATIYNYVATLSGPAESPPNASPGTGLAYVDYNDVAHTMAISLTFSGLTGPTTASHIHAATTLPGTGTAGVATTTPYFAGFPIGVTSGSYSTLMDLTLTTSWNGSYITANGGTTAGAEAAFALALAGDKAYFNIHTSPFPGGEIRGFLVPVPEPSSMALAGLGSLALLIAKRRKLS